MYGVKFMGGIPPFHPVSLIQFDLRVTGRLTAAMRRGRDVIPVSVCTDQLAVCPASTWVVVLDLEYTMDPAAARGGGAESTRRVGPLRHAWSCRLTHRVRPRTRTIRREWLAQ